MSGLSPAAQAFVVAAAEGPTLVVVPTDVRVEEMAADAKFFLASLHGISEAEAGRSVLPLPSTEINPYRSITPHLDVAAARARVLTELAQGTAKLVIASVAALLSRVSGPDRILRASREFTVGDISSPTTLENLLADAGFIHEDPVEQYGQFCVRGGVVDFFQVGEDYPVRFEFSGDLIESLRQYDPSTQRSIASLDRTTVIPLRDTFENIVSDNIDSGKSLSLDRSSSLLDFLSRVSSIRTFLCETTDCEQSAEKMAQQVQKNYEDALSRNEIVPTPTELLVNWQEIRTGLPRIKQFETLELDKTDSQQVHHISCQPAMVFHGRLSAWIDEVHTNRERGERQVVVAATPGRTKRITELLTEYDLPVVSFETAEIEKETELLVVTGQLSRGFRLQEAGLQIYTETDLFDKVRHVRDKRKSIGRLFLPDLRDLRVGDHVVHIDHGIGEFIGLKQIIVGEKSNECMELRYANGDKLFVPVENLDLIQKYTGAKRPTIDRLGGTTWERAKTRVRRAMRDMAEELLKLYAARKTISRQAFSIDTHWQEEFEDAFEHELTPDQETALREIKHDMESSVPMDRLLCGDVGYGKTEIALRAAFKAVMDGKQVAILAPTTVLAFQHCKTLAKRFAAFPVRIEMLSRFRSKTEQNSLVADLIANKIEIIVGTHRLLSKDIRFHDLGLLIVDEEQRFGVSHKERIKQIRHGVDVLTLTATPIPRTLNMSLMGIRDMSIIETPPKDRLSIQTNVVKFDNDIIARAIKTELDRKGQVYFVHNRIDSIDAMASLIMKLVPGVRVAFAHRRSSETHLEQVMIDFVAHQYDVLLSTTIIENGLDIPNVNTLIVNHAEQYGLAQLYQLRGRVGRSDRRAYAYLLIPGKKGLSRVAQDRLAAIKEFSDLGSGFRIAALDLEIRGAGNFLGAEQSGHIEAVGFDMYVKLLEQTVSEIKGDEVKATRRATVNLGLELRIEDGYIVEENQRLDIYRRIAGAEDENELATVMTELADRYGPVPTSVLRLVEYGRIRVLADHLGVESIEREKNRLMLTFRNNSPLDPAHLIALVQARSDLKLMPPGVVKMDLQATEAVINVKPKQSKSWWTKHATEGQVNSGFSKGDILQADYEGVTDHIFEQVNDLLEELSSRQ